MKSAILTILSIACIASYSAPQATYSVATNISEGVTRKIVTKQFIEGLGVVSTDTNAVRDIISDEITPATNSLYTTINGSIDVKRDKDDLAVYEVVRTENTDWTLTTNVVDRLATTNGVNAAIAENNVGYRVRESVAWSGAAELAMNANGVRSADETRSGAMLFEQVDGKATKTELAGYLPLTGGYLKGPIYFDAGGRIYTDQGGISVNTHQGLNVYNGGSIVLESNESLTDFGNNPIISATNPSFSNAVLAVGLNIDTNSVAVINEIAATFGGFPIEGTATTVGGLLAALAAAAAWLKKNKVGSFDSVGGASATVDNGVAKLDDFFTNSNSLLTGTIDAEVISKGTAPDAHLEAPTDERLKLILADSSVAYDSAKALPYKLTSVIGDRVIATMTLTAASTDITLPTIAANDTTVKDFILDVTNAYAVEGVATDAGINIPRTDFKLVTRDGESLTDVTTVKAGKSAFICFTQKSPVVVDGTTYPCWCVIQLPFGDPS